VSELAFIRGDRKQSIFFVLKSSLLILIIAPLKDLVFWGMMRRCVVCMFVFLLY